MNGRGKWAGAVVGAAALVVAVYPGLYVAGDVLRGLSRGGAGVPVRLSAAALLDTLEVAVAIGALATLIALPAAWASRRWASRAFVLVMVPMLMPSYLAYIGWGLLRAPGTWLGDFLMRGPPGVGASGNWYPVVATKVFAAGGLVLWSWPLAAVVMGMSFRGIDQSVVDALRLEAAGWGRVRALAAMGRGGVLLAVGLVALVMVGSVVPLHVAQFEVFGVQIWRSLDEVPAAERWRVWWGAWPLAVVAVAVGVALWRRGEGLGGIEGENEERSGWAGIGAALVWGLSVLAPMGLLVWNARGWGSVVRFWKLASGSFWWSAAIAVVVGVVGAGLVCCVWVGLGGRSAFRGTSKVQSRTPLGCVLNAACLIFLVAGLMPGVLVGSGMARAFGVAGLRWIGDSGAVVVLGHIARFGFVAVLAGRWLARTEGRELREMRGMDGGGVRGWIESALWPRAGLVAGVGVACGLLSFHEIEATVMLQPPTSMGGGFAWKVLQALHFAREEDLVPAMLIVMVVGLGLALGVVGLIGFGLKERGRVSQ